MPFQGSGMESRPVLSIDYIDDAASPWPRILRIIALFGIVYGAISAASEALNLKTFLSLGAPGAATADRNLMFISEFLQIAIYIFLTVAAAIVLKHPRSLRLLVAASWTWVALYVLGMGMYFLRLIWNSVSVLPNGVGWMVLSTVHQIALPFLIILLLRQCAKDHVVSGGRPSSALPNGASHDVQASSATAR